MRFLLLLLALGVFAPAPFATAATPLPPAVDAAGRVLFIGDSITFGGAYVDFIETVIHTRAPDWRGEIIDLGLSSETVSGLSEAGHAGGKFPRPDLRERLGRVLAQDMELRRHLSGQPRYNPAAAGAAAAAATAGAPPDTERVLKAWEELCKSVQALTDSSKNAKSGSDREPAGVKLTLGCEADPWL